MAGETKTKRIHFGGVVKFWAEVARGARVVTRAAFWTGYDDPGVALGDTCTITERGVTRKYTCQRITAGEDEAEPMMFVHWEPAGASMFPEVRWAIPMHLVHWCESHMVGDA